MSHMKNNAIDHLNERPRWGVYNPKKYAQSTCKQCGGSGIMWIMVNGEPEKDLCVCVEYEEQTTLGDD